MFKGSHTFPYVKPNNFIVTILKLLFHCSLHVVTHSSHSHEIFLLLAWFHVSSWVTLLLHLSCINCSSFCGKFHICNYFCLNYLMSKLTININFNILITSIYDITVFYIYIKVSIDNLLSLSLFRTFFFDFLLALLQVTVCLPATHCSFSDKIVSLTIHLLNFQCFFQFLLAP